MATSDLREELTCSICLNLYTEPVSLRCGHNFCRACIVSALGTQKSGVYSCPECRDESTERPPLAKNTVLCNIVDNFRSARQKESEVLCTYCDFSVPAAKTCLLCEASFCNKHLTRHSKSGDHILTKPTSSFEERKCSAHKEVLKYYCTEDGVCICMSCWVAGDHKGHKVDLLKEASEKKKENLRESTNTLNSQRQETEKRIQSLENHRTEEKAKATAVNGRVTELFRDIRKQLDDLEKRVLSENTRQEERISQSVTDQIRQLETQKDDLSGKVNQMEELCSIQDPLELLKKSSNGLDVSHEIGGHLKEEGKVECLNEGIISEMLDRGLLRFADGLIDLKKKRQFSVIQKSDILLDINTAHNNIILAEDLKTASYTDISQNRPDGPERFESKQVLNTNSFTSGKHYWAVDVSGADEWLIGVVSHSIERKIAGNESFIGYNEKSWGLACRPKLSAIHKFEFTSLSSDSPVKSIGIYLDYEAGHLSFYQLYDPIRHLHTFTATFTEPLHAALYIFEKASIRIDT